MDIFSMVGIAIGLSMDACAISVASGVLIKRQKMKKAITFGVMFGAFQMIMPVIGYAAGRTFRGYIEAIDHWVVFGLLLFIGAKMIYEAIKIEKMESAAAELTALVLTGLAIATSIDALAVGIGFAFIDAEIVIPVIIIGVVTFVFSFFGVLLGNKLGSMCEKRMEIIGGLALIGIGVMILIEHLMSY
jgi:putative Mn2+ efflux pump MntP